MIDYNDTYGDNWIEKKEDEMVYVSLSINSLRKDM